jgi:hypothetical protein
MAAAACVLGVVLGVGGVLGWQQWSVSSERVLGSAPLTALPGAPSGVSGNAQLVQKGDRHELVVDTRGLPLTQGFYEAWMFVPTSNEMQAMGAIRPGEVTRFALPVGLDPTRWPGVDISLEQFDGNPAHSAISVLRGELRS